MKIRNGFVSNSSSSSFTCDVCGNTESGMDASLRDFEMSQCERGHVFCNCHQEDMFKKDKQLSGEWEEFQESDEYDYYELPSRFCPICTMNSMNDSDVLRYVLKCSGRTFQSFVDEIKEKYKGNYGGFAKDLK